MVIIQMMGNLRYPLKGPFSATNIDASGIDLRILEAICIDVSDGYTDLDKVRIEFPHLVSRYTNHYFYGDTAKMILSTCFGDGSIW